MRKNHRYVLVLILALILFAYLGLTQYLGAGRDDSFITLWAGENLAVGKGFVNHNFETVEISSSMLHTLVVAGLALINQSWIYFLNKLVGLFAGGFILWLIFRFREVLIPWPEHRFLAYSFIQAALSTTPAFVYWALGGLETPFVTLLCTLAGILLILYWREPGAGIGILLIIVQSFLILARPEGFFIVLFTVIFLALFSWSSGWTWRTLPLVILPSAFFFALGLFRLSLFRAFWPNPVYAKASLGAWKFSAGLSYLREFYGSSLFVLFLGMASGVLVFHYGILLVRSLKTRELLKTRKDGFLILLLGLVVTGHLFVLLSGGDWMEYFRFMHPVFPFMVVLSLGFTVRILSVVVARVNQAGVSAPVRWGFPLLAAACFLFLIVQNFYQKDRVTSWKGDMYIHIGSSATPCRLLDLLAAGSELDERVKMLNKCYARDKELLFPFLGGKFVELYQQSGALVIATPQMGLFPYYLKRKYPDFNLTFIDTRGLCDPNVAHMDIQNGPYGIEWGGSLARIIAGEVGPLSEYVLSKKTNMLYRVNETPWGIVRLEEYGFRTVLKETFAMVFFNPHIHPSFLPASR